MNVYENPSINWANGLIRGDQETQYQLLRRIMKTKARMPVLISLAATLTGRLNLPNFVVNIYGFTGTGKSLSVRFAVSLLGSPSMGATWNATPRGLIDFAYGLQNMPLFIDDFGIVQDSWSMVSDFLEQFTSLDGRRNGMRGTIITTTEWDARSIDRRFSRQRHLTSGTYSKLIEINIDRYATNGSLFREPDGVSIDTHKIASTAEAHYGHFALDWRRYIGNNANRIVEQYRSLTQGYVRIHRLTNKEQFVAALRVVTSALADMGFVSTENMPAINNELSAFLEPSRRQYARIL